MNLSQEEMKTNNPIIYNKFNINKNENNVKFSLKD